MRKVEAPIIAPNRCIFCPQGHRGGQVIDSEIDYPFGRLYVCLLHAELIAVAAGYAEGEECERLKSADVLLAEAEKGTALERELRQALATTVNELEERVQELAGERDHALIRANQAEAKLAELGQDIGATLAAVGHEPDPVWAHEPKLGQVVKYPPTTNPNNAP